MFKVIGMDRKIILAIAIAIVAILGIFLVYASEDSSVNVNNVTLNVSSEGPVNLSVLTDEIRTHEYYKGYDNETLQWMESLGNKQVWLSNGEIVIMDDVSDSNKIPSAYVCDASFYEIFSCNVLENRSLGNVEHPKDVLLVNNVEYIGEYVYYWQV